ncbi:MAG: plasmid pRiA4b ORF-3 family protein [Candidatus Roseilinea sp.]|uniref:plasmid pRiA4b ORF-3 family protein n=1 Tax=Candidatus Roseilinea sp. TaxID=2838777 RepID=UPI0040499E57
MPARSIQDAVPIYQLKITLRGIRQPIWRRVLIPGSFSLHKLHKIIQVVMGWMDCHLHCFRVGDATCSEPDSATGRTRATWIRAV